MQRVLFIQDVILACLLSQFLMYTAAPWMREQWDSLLATEEVADQSIDAPFSAYDIDLDLPISEEMDAHWLAMHPPRADFCSPNLE